MISLIIALLWLFGIGYLFYNRVALTPFTAITGIALVITTILHPFSVFTLFIAWLVFFAIFVPLNMADIRKKYLTHHLFHYASKSTVKMSETEKVALEAGHTWWEGELFRGKPDWDLLMNYPAPTLSKDELDFINGPCEQLCSMLDDWKITHQDVDLPPKVWNFIKENHFFGMIVPKEYGGLAFSAVAHTAVVTKLSSVSITAATSVSVPNSLGPAELLLHYGTDEQKNYYLPRLVKGEEIPCFALTGVDAGSDASSISDYGVVCYGKYNDKEILGIRLNFKKRYITLAPIATVVGLAFKLYDPDNLLENNIEDYGITCALIPRDTKGIEIGDRHFPLNSAFQNGPVIGHDVFIPLDFIIGGIDMAGQGWRMLMECLAAGRAISLPSTSSGGSNASVLLTSAYARIRKQFNTPICGFEGIQEALSRIIGLNYISNAARLETAAALDRGVKPSVISAILKYHITEYGRQIGLDTMDILGGKGICLGPNNFAARGYQASPIAITVEGANILTRNMIIFGQGAIRCHPFILEEMSAISNKDLEHFDNLIYRHAGYLMSNAVRSFWLSLTSGRFSYAPKNDSTQKYYQWLNKFSANLAFMADLAMITMGGKLKRKESISARLGDILSYTYLMSTVLKFYSDQKSPSEELILVDWCCKYLAYKAQTAINETCHNLPNRFIRIIMKIVTLPIGKPHKIPSDKLNKEITKLTTQSSSTRKRIMKYVYHGDYPNNFIKKLDIILEHTIAAEPIAKRFEKAVKNREITSLDYHLQLEEAVSKHILTSTESEILAKNHEEILSVINVDKFKHEELISYSSVNEIKTSEKLAVVDSGKK